MERCVIIAAGGSGTRMGTQRPKQFLELAGVPLLMRTVLAFHAFDNGMEIILVLAENHQKEWGELCKKHNCSVQQKITTGGETRFHSVKNGLALAPDNCIIGVHDGVRCLVSQETIGRAFSAAGQHGSAVPVIAVSESLRSVDGPASQHVDRSAMRLVQTPQCFRSALLKKAYEQEYTPAFTDDASVVESMGESIHLVEGNTENIKITEPADLKLAEALLKE